VEERGDLEEERRLFYVAVTRAERMLVLSRSEMRVLHGELRFNPPSPLLFEVPEEVMAQAEAIDLRTIREAAERGNRGGRASLEAAGLGGERVRTTRPTGGEGMVKSLMGRAGDQLKRFGGRARGDASGGNEEGATASFGRSGGGAAAGGGAAGGDNERHWVPIDEEEEAGYGGYTFEEEGGRRGPGGGGAGGRGLEAPDLFSGGGRGRSGGGGGRPRDVRRTVGGRGQGAGADGVEGEDGPTAADLFGGGGGSRPSGSPPLFGGSAPKRRVGIPRRTSGGGGSGAGSAASSDDPLPWAAVGVRIRHEHYGEGIIIGQSGRGRDRRLLVTFDEDESRQLEILARFANLDKIED
jgi:hypothetical protein